MGDIFVSIFIFVVSGLFYAQIISYHTMVGYEKMGPGFWPGLNLIGMMIISIILFLRAVKNHRKGVSKKSSPLGRGVLVVGGLLFFYILVIPYLGFLFTSFLAMSSFIYILGERRKVHIFATSFFLVGLI